jgi:hypothetical protein
LYQSIRPGKSSSYVLPEHIVLLHLVRSMIEEAPHNEMKIISSCNSRCYMLGGEVEDDGHCIMEAHCFLTSLYLALRDSTSSPCDGEADLRPAAIQLVLDVLAESLAEDSKVAATIRYAIGTETLFLQAAVSDLAAVLDAWYVENKQVYTRDQQKLNETDQCRITASVRVLGNLCYHCGPNQDLLRQVMVPYSNSTSKKRKDVVYVEGPSKQMDRNGLHVLLSTTCMSYACFTLREWAVVAIRAALEECPRNQAVVAELEAQASVNSSDLEDMGIRVNLDLSKGTLSVAQLND